MGFWKGFGRLIAGKPVFQVGDDVPHDSAPEVTPIDEVQPQPVDNLRDASGRKIVPQINITHVKSHLSGGNMSVTAWVANSSDVSIRLDRCMVLSRQVSIYRDLAPGQGHEVELYRGAVAANEHDYRAWIVYRILENTDEFEMNYTTRFYRNADGTFVVDQLQPNGGVKDI